MKEDFIAFYLRYHPALYSKIRTGLVMLLPELLAKGMNSGF